MQDFQALVTKQIQELESWLGARLLNRTGNVGSSG
jgi:DNA-binding transcriptional LysR family regulator